MDGESLDELNRRRDARNRENVALAGLGIRTSADIFEAAERQFQEAISWKAPVPAGPADASALASLGIRTVADISEESRHENFRQRRRKRSVESLGQVAGEAEDAAGDVAQDAKQWAALSGELEPVVDAAESGSAERDNAQSAAYRSGTVGTATRLIDVMRNAISTKEITAGSKEISAMVEQIYRFQTAALEPGDDLYSTVFPEAETRTVSILGGTVSGAEAPGQEQLRSIKGQQAGLSRERKKAIQGMQSRSNGRG